MPSPLKRKLAHLEASLVAHYVTPAQCNGRFLPAERDARMRVIFPRDPQAARCLLAELACLVKDLNEGNLSSHIPGTLCDRRPREHPHAIDLRRVVSVAEFMAFATAHTAAIRAAIPDPTCLRQFRDTLIAKFVEYGVISPDAAERLH